MIFDKGPWSTREEIVCYFEVARLFCAFRQSFGGETFGGDEGKGFAEDLVLERGVCGCGRVIGGMVSSKRGGH